MSASARNMDVGLRVEDLGLRPLREGEEPCRLMGSLAIVGVGFMVDAIEVVREWSGIQVPVDPRDEEDFDRFVSATGSDGGVQTISIPGYGDRRYALFLVPFDE